MHLPGNPANLITHHYKDFALLAAKPRRVPFRLAMLLVIIAPPPSEKFAVRYT